MKDLVGASGFEPPTSWSRTRRSSQAEPRPERFQSSIDRRIPSIAHSARSNVAVPRAINTPQHSPHARHQQRVRIYQKEGNGDHARRKCERCAARAQQTLRSSRPSRQDRRDARAVHSICLAPRMAARAERLPDRLSFETHAIGLQNPTPDAFFVLTPFKSFVAELARRLPQIASSMFKDFEHLIRMALVLLAGAVLFLLVRQAIVPKSFGQYGHYRAAALDDIRARPVSFAGRQACETCHVDEAAVKSKGKHAGLGCEACHGPSARHAEDPTTVQAVKPDPATLCVRCHEAEPAKPKTFPQVVSKEHSGGASCVQCHQPHSPQVGG